VSATTIAEIARASGAPVGSLYHRFGSRDDMLAQLWIRAVRRSQASFLTAVDSGDPIQGAVAGATAILDFWVRSTMHHLDTAALLTFLDQQQ
jgi:AcrR family transcriptional regulator